MVRVSFFFASWNARSKGVRGWRGQAVGTGGGWNAADAGAGSHEEALLVSPPGPIPVVYQHDFCFPQQMLPAKILFLPIFYQRNKRCVDDRRRRIFFLKRCFGGEDPLRT